MAGKLAASFSTSSTIRLAWEPQANEVFCHHATSDDGADSPMQAPMFYDWHVPASFDGEIGLDEVLCRFVTSFATTEDDIAGFARLITNR